MNAPIIETQNYQLRPFKNADAELWQTWDVDAQVQAHMPEPANQPQDITEQYAYIKACDAEEDGYYWSIETKTNVTIGTIALTDINHYHQLAELGIVIGDTSYWNKGVATEAIAAVIHYAFTELKIIRISAEVESANVAAANMLTKVGFIQDGAFASARVKNSQRVTVLHFGIVSEGV